MSDFKFNAFQIKRQAHAASRAGDAGFNPFGHIRTNRNRRQSWGDAEAGRHAHDADPVEHSQTAPTGAYGAFGHGIERRTSEPIEAAHPSPDQGQQSEQERADSSSNTALPFQAPGPDFSTIGTGAQLRHRPRVEKEEKRKEGRRFFKNVQHKEPFTVGNQIRRVFGVSWLNLLLFCVPVGISLGAAIGPSLETFFVNYAAVIPLYWLGDFAMTEIGLRTGALVSNYIGISTSNLVQLVSCIVLLVQGRTSILQATLIGGILANILLLLGLAMFFGAMRRREQYFNRTSSHTSSVLLSLASTSVLIPTASLLMGQTTESRINKQSRGAAVILIFVYCLYLYFCLHTHREMFVEAVPRAPKIEPPASARIRGSIKKGLVSPSGLVGIPGDGNNTRVREVLEGGGPDEDTEDDDDEEAEPELDIRVALLTFVATTALLYFCVDYVVGSIDALTSGTGVPATFVGLVLLPVLNCDFTPIISAVHDDMNATMDYTVGRSIQTALLVTPFTVLLAWWLGIEGVTLVFDGFEVVSLFATVLLLNLIISEGKNNWAMGILLLADWALVAIAAFFVD